VWETLIKVFLVPTNHQIINIDEHDNVITIRVYTTETSRLFKMICNLGNCLLFVILYVVIFGVSGSLQFSNSSESEKEVFEHFVCC